MAITEEQRSEIYGSLSAALGQPAAEFVMAQYPPEGWEQMATKRDLADLKVQTQTSFIETNTKMDIGFTAADAKMGVGFAETAGALIAADAKMDVGFAETAGALIAADAKMERGFAAVDKQFGNVDRQFAKLSENRGRDFYAIIFAIMIMGVAICGVVLAS